MTVTLISRPKARPGTLRRPYVYRVENPSTAEVLHTPASDHMVAVIGLELIGTGANTYTFTSSPDSGNVAASGAVARVYSFDENHALVKDIPRVDVPTALFYATDSTGRLGDTLFVQATQNVTFYVTVLEVPFVL